MSFMWQSDSRAAAATIRAPANAPKPIYFENEQDIAHYYPLARQQARGKKPGGANIAHRAAADQAEMQQQLLHKQAKQEEHVRDWFEASEKAMHLRQALRRKNLIAQEVDCANTVLVESRRARLREVLEAEHEQYVAELAKKGLAIYN